MMMMMIDDDDDNVRPSTSKMTATANHWQAVLLWVQRLLISPILASQTLLHLDWRV